MSDIKITLTREELSLIMAAMTAYRLKGFPAGRSSYHHPIGYQDRQSWAALGMRVWNMLYELTQTETKGSGGL